MHILHIYKDYPPVMGGIEHHVRDLAEGQAARNYQVTVLVTSVDRRTTISTPLPNLTIIRAGRDLHAASTPLSSAMYWHALRLRPDLVHLQFPYPPGDLAAHLLPGWPPLVISYQSDIVRQRNLLRLYRPLLCYTLNRAACILASSPAYIRSSPWLQAHLTKCRVLPIGIDTDRFASADPQLVAQWRARIGSRPALLFVGRLRYYKGLHLLIEALRQLPDPQLVIVGTGPEQQRLVAQVEQAGLQERVRFLGDLPDTDLPALHRACDLFVLPSHLRAEAFGIAQAEALASGMACISTELGTGTSFVNRHTETGIVVPAGDVPAMVRAIHVLLANPALRHWYGQQAQQRMRQLFSKQHMLNQLDAIYLDVLRG
jgi:rhamnosyl/mannosyltransferase